MKKYLILILATTILACNENEPINSAPVLKTSDLPSSSSNPVFRTPNRKLINPIPTVGEPCKHSLEGNCGPVIYVRSLLFQRIQTAIDEGTVANLFLTDTEVIEKFALSQQALTDLQNGVTTLMRVRDVFVIVFAGSSDPFNYPSYLNG